MKKLMFALDGSPLAECALLTGEALARRWQAEILLVRVVEPYMPGLPGALTSLATRLAELHRQEAEPYLRNVAEDLIARGFKVRPILRVGSARHELAKVARDEQVDMVVMSSHGRSGPGRWLLGSIAEWVLRHSPCPVLLVRICEPPGEPLQFSRILVPLDGSERSQAALPMLAELADGGTRVLLLRAADLDDLRLEPAERQTVLDSIRHDLEGVSLPEVSRGACATALKVERLVVDSRPAVAILETARRERCDLILMTTHGRTGPSRALLGSVAERVARHSECHVLIVPARPEGSQPWPWPGGVA
ncbi:MAG: universal stress protein [Candidatus Eremiobacterota bacterium]